MKSASQSAVPPSRPAALTLATRHALSWTTTTAARAATATGDVELSLETAAIMGLSIHNNVYVTVV